MNLKHHEIIESAGTDYPFRLIASKAEFADALREIALGIAWTNVKAEAEQNASTVGHDFSNALHDVWGTFRRQAKRERR